MNIKTIVKSFKKKTLDASIKGTNLVTIDARELTDLRLAVSNARATAQQTPLTKGQLTQQQLGSYLPNFVELAKKPDDFKNSLGLLCKNLIASEEWQYLIEHLKQDQVNLSLFGEERKPDDWVRGSINGIYVVDDMVSTLGRNFDQRMKEGGGSIGAIAPKPTAK